MYKYHRAHQNISLRFQFRKTRSTTTGDQLGIIQIVLSFPVYPRGSVHYGPYATPIEATREVWDARRSPRPTEKVRELNRQLTTYQASLEEAHAELEREIKQEGSTMVIDGPAVMDALKRLQLGGFSPISLQQVYQQFYAAKVSLVEGNREKRKVGQIAANTLKTYPKRWVLIQQFLLHQKTPKLPVASINFRFATELKEWLQCQQQSRVYNKPYDPATIHKVIGLLKMLLTYAQSKEYIRVNVLLSFTTPRGSVANPKPLTSFQMDHLETCFLPPMLRFQCDSWLVAAELCLHYADYSELPKMRFVESESGVVMLQHARTKQTGSNLVQTVNVTPRAARILEKYNGPKGLYYTSSAYWSKLLKNVARLAELRESEGNIIPLQFGQGRDTGLTQRAIEGANGIQLSRMAGWANPTHAKQYIGNSVDIVSEFVKQIEFKSSQPFLQIHKTA